MSCPYGELFTLAAAVTAVCVSVILVFVVVTFLERYEK